MKHLTPHATWALLQERPQALFIDVRMEIESLYVGRPPGVHIMAWYEYPDLTPNAPDFVRQVSHEVQNLRQGKDHTVILICRSGKRSVDAGLALEAAGFTDVVNVLHGFEGDLDEHFHRSTVNGWRHDNLPWEQM